MNPAHAILCVADEPLPRVLVAVGKDVHFELLQLRDFVARNGLQFEGELDVGLPLEEGFHVESEPD